MKRLPLYLFFLFPVLLLGQNAIVGTGFSTGWGGSCGSNSNFTYFSAGAGTSYQITRNANGTFNQFFRIGVDWGGQIRQHHLNATGTDVEVSPNTEYTLNATCVTNGAMYTNVASTSHNYVFKTMDASATPSYRLIFFAIQGSVRTISSVNRSPSAPYVGQDVIVTATLDNTFATGQSAYLRYTTNNWSSSSVLEMTGSGTTYTATIPGSANATGAPIQYYCFTSGNGVASNIAHNEADWYTINLNNNGGSNYSYTVGSTYGTTTGGACDGKWSTGACWLNGSAPSNQDVVIRESITLDMNASVKSIVIDAGKTLTSDPSPARTLTINGPGGVFTCNGTFTANNGTVIFIDDTNDATNCQVSGTVTFNDVRLQGGGTNFGSSSTVTGQLIIDANGYVSGNAPTYATGSFLVYNTGVNYGRRSEWDLKTPHNVQIVSGALDVGANGGTGTARTVNGSLIINSGCGFYMDFGSNDMTATVTVNGNVTNNGILSLSEAIGGDLIVKGNFTQNNTFNCKEREVTLNGTSTQTLSGNLTGGNKIDYLRVNNSSGVILGGNLEVDNRIALTSGNITLGTNQLIFNANAPGTIVDGSGLQNFSITNMIVTDNTGTLQIKNIGITATLFPIGTGALTYNPVTIANSGTVDQFSARVSTDVSPSHFNPTQMVNRMWTLTEGTAGGSNLTLTFRWNTGETTGGFNCGGTVVVGRHNNTTWEQTVTSSKSCSAPFSATASGFTALSPFAVGNEASLPVELTDFFARPDGNSVELLWRTATEMNNSHFDIERSANSREWAAIGTVQGWGTTLELHDYTFTDHQPLSGSNYYRLKQVDFDGTFEYSRVIFVEMKNQAGNPFIYPNPAKESIFWDAANRNSNNLTATILDPKGIVRLRQVTIDNSLDVSTLTPGVYIILMENEDRQLLLRERFVKN